MLLQHADDNSRFLRDIDSVAKVFEKLGIRTKQNINGRNVVGKKLYIYILLFYR